MGNLPGLGFVKHGIAFGINRVQRRRQGFCSEVSGSMLIGKFARQNLAVKNGHAHPVAIVQVALVVPVAITQAGQAVLGVIGQGPAHAFHRSGNLVAVCVNIS